MVFSTIVQFLIVHIILGYRQLSESEFYREDPLVKRVLGLKAGLLSCERIQADR